MIKNHKPLAFEIREFENMEQGHKNRTLAWLEQRVRNSLKTAKINKNLNDVDAQRVNMLRATTPNPRRRPDPAAPANPAVPDNTTPALATALGTGSPTGGKPKPKGGKGKEKGPKGDGKGKKSDKSTPNPPGGGAAPKFVTAKDIQNYGQLPVRLKDHCAAFHASKCPHSAEARLAATGRKHDTKLPGEDKAVLRAAFKIEDKRKRDRARSTSQAPKDTKGKGKAPTPTGGDKSRDSTPPPRTSNNKVCYACTSFRTTGKCDFANCKFLHVPQEEAVRAGLTPPSPKAGGKGAKAAVAALADALPAAPAILCVDDDGDSDGEAHTTQRESAAGPAQA